MNYTLCECGHYKIALQTEVSDFSQQYWSIAQRYAPQLRMRKPGPNGLRAKFIRFFPLGLPSGVSLLHNLSYDSVDLKFDYFGHQLEKLHGIYGAHLERHATIVKVGRSAAICLSVPRVNPQLPFAPQTQSVIAAICAAEERLQWLRHLLSFHMVHHPGYRPT